MRLTRLACRLTIGVAACLGGLATATRALPQGRDPTSSPLELEAVIPLGAVRGRIDHMAIDLARRRLYIAELGNDSVAIVDLGTPVGVDNVDAYRLMIQSFRWR